MSVQSVEICLINICLLKGQKMESQPIVPQRAAWYDRLTTMQEGYYYPWRSQLPPNHGEDAYLDLVEQHLRPDSDVLDAACGHGEVALDIAPRCRSVQGYDRTAPWIDLARQAATERGLQNATFVCHDSSGEANGGQAHLPGPDAAYDLLLCSKGPFHWIEGVRRVARPGAMVLIAGTGCSSTDHVACPITRVATLGGIRRSQLGASGDRAQAHLCRSALA